MCVARTSKAASRLSASFRAREGVEKIYHAVVAGRLSGRGVREDVLVSTDDSGATARGGRGPRTTVIQCSYDSAALSVSSAAVPNASLSSSLSSTRACFPTCQNHHRLKTLDADRSFRDAQEGMTLPSLQWSRSSSVQAKHNNFNSTRMVEAKRAVLEWEAIDLSPLPARRLQCPRTGDPRTLVRVRLITGRKHQIRAQLAGMGHPVVGDVRYGRARRARDGTASGCICDMYPLEKGSILLHASELAVPHPTRVGETVRVVAPPPKAWRELCGREVVEEVWGGK